MQNDARIREAAITHLEARSDAIQNFSERVRENAMASSTSGQMQNQEQAKPSLLSRLGGRVHVPQSFAEDTTPENVVQSRNDRASANGEGVYTPTPWFRPDEMSSADLATQ